jgi:photosystem II stability/assembly factor-like uncharacterized protein
MLLMFFILPVNVKYPVIVPASVEKLEKLAEEKVERVPPGTIFYKRMDSLSTWTFIGPMPIVDEYWSGDTFASGRVTAIVVDPYDPQVAYIGGAQGGVWKTSDGGESWVPLTDHISSLATGALALDPSNPDIIYYGTGEQHFCGDCFYGDGLFKSLDGGVTWVKIASTSQVGSYISRIIVDPWNPDIIHLGSDLGYLKSSDGGETWSLNLSIFWCTDIVLRSDNPSTIFVAIHSYGIFRSTDGGETWTQLTNGLPSVGFRRINMAISPSNPDIIYASFISDDGSLEGMYKTTDGGDSWFLLPNTPNYVGYQGWYDNCVIVDPTDPDIVYAGGVFPYGSDYNGLIKSTDGGNTWIDITVGIDGSQLHPDQHALAFGPDGTLWVGNDGGVWKTVDGGLHWINLNESLGVTQFYTVTPHPYDSNFILGGTQDNGTVYYPGDIGWYQQNAGDGGPSAFEWDSPNIYYTSYVRLSYLYKWDNGNLLGNVAGPWGNDRVSWCNAPLVVDPNNPNTLLAGTHRVWKTTNSGISWFNISGDLTGGYGYLSSIAIAPQNSNIIYTGSSDGKVYITTDGSNWMERDGGIFGNNPITDIWVSPDDWMTVYLSVNRSTGGRVYMTTDSGNTWIDITGDLPDGLRGLCLGVDFRTSQPHLYLGTDYGVYVSLNGQHWIKQEDIPNLAIYDIAIDTLNGFVIAASHGRGMWRGETPVGVKEVASYKGNLYLKVKPNPLKDFAEINYSIPEPKELKVEVFNISGQKVREFKGFESTYGTIYWNTKGIKEGVYFIILKGEGFRLRKRVVILK